MSEENKALETLKEVASDDFDTLGDDISPKMARNILNLIDKQQKEIEDMREELQMYVDVGNNDLHNYISKDKIREKIKEYDKWIKQGEYIESLEAQKYALNELLEEN